MGDLRKWLEQGDMEFFIKIGLKKGQIALDFGCGAGNYAIPAVVNVGREGRVYALDKEMEKGVFGKPE